MYQNVKTFVRDFPTIIIKKEAQSYRVKDPVSKGLMSLADLIGYLVAQFEAKQVAIDGVKNSHELDDFLLLLKAGELQTKVVLELNHAIQVARANGFLDEGSLKELRDLKEKNIVLENDLRKLKDEYQQLKRNYDGLRNLLGSEESTLEEDHSRRDDAP